MTANGAMPVQDRAIQRLALLRALSGIEQALKDRLVDRRVWLVTAGGMFVTLMLSLVQARTEAFDTMQLMARLLLALEVTLLLIAWVLAAGAASTPPRATRGLAGGVVLLLQFAVLLLPMLALHSYPELAREGIRVQLMLLQHGLLLLLCAMTTYHLLLGARLQFKLPGWAAGPLVLGLYALASYSFAGLSKDNPVFSRLNDLFYWNQLWLHLPDFPQLQTEYWTYLIPISWFAYYLLLLIGAAVVSLVFWLPAALIRDARETSGVFADRA